MFPATKIARSRNECGQTMKFLTLAFWLILILVTGLGLYRYWTRRLGGAAVDWLMLPATLVGEVAYSAGRLMTGRPAFGGLISPRDVREDACRFAISGKNGFYVSMLSSFLTFILCSLSLASAIKWLGQPTVQSLVLTQGLPALTLLPKELPLQWGSFWDFLVYQIDLLRRFCEMLSRQDFLKWQTGAFLYLSGIFSVRLGPVRHDWRATIVVGVILAALSSAAATMIPAMGDFVDTTLWYAITYVWGMLLFLLALTMVLTGVAALAYPFLPARMRAE